jgi:hypothetical protein
MMKDCNICCYSSVVRRNGVVSLHCALVGKVLDRIVEDCELAKDAELYMLEVRDAIPEGELIAS